MSIVVTEEIDAAIADVWNLVGNFARLDRWHPELRSCTAVGEGAGAVRTVRFAADTVEERLERVDPEGHGIGYAVIGGTRPMMIGLRAAIRLTALGPGRTRIEWRAGTDADHPFAQELAVLLASLYPRRIQHLREAVHRHGHRPGTPHGTG